MNLNVDPKLIRDGVRQAAKLVAAAEAKKLPRPPVAGLVRPIGSTLKARG